MKKTSKAAPIIGISTYGVNEAGKYDLQAEYIHAVRRAGGAVILLPPGESEWKSIVPLLDGLVLSAGGDINPERYAGEQHETIYNVNNSRDDSECYLAEYALSESLPTLGICRGAQILNIVTGGSLYEHLPDAYGEETIHRLPPKGPTPHTVILEGESRLADILQQPQFECVSWHHQALKNVSDEFAVVARAPDGVVEAIEHRTHPWLIAVQWHPELSAAEDPLQQELFNAHVRFCRKTG